MSACDCSRLVTSFHRSLSLSLFLFLFLSFLHSPLRHLRKQAGERVQLVCSLLFLSLSVPNETTRLSSCFLSARSLLMSAAESVRHHLATRCRFPVFAGSRAQTDLVRPCSHAHVIALGRELVRLLCVATSFPSALSSPLFRRTIEFVHVFSREFSRRETENSRRVLHWQSS